MKTKKWFWLKISLLTALILLIYEITELCTEINAHSEYYNGEGLGERNLSYLFATIFFLAVCFCFFNLYLLRQWNRGLRHSRITDLLFITGYAFFCITTVCNVLVLGYAFLLFASVQKYTEMFSNWQEAGKVIFCFAALIASAYIVYASAKMRRVIMGWD